MLTKRLRSEYRSLVKNPDPDIVLQPHEENLRHWVAHIRGPADSPFHEGVFRLRVEAGLQYPMTPPTISFEKESPATTRKPRHARDPFRMTTISTAIERPG